MKKIALMIAVLATTQMGVMSGAVAQDVAQEKTTKPTKVNPIVATVDGKTIHFSDVESARGLLPAQLQSAPLQNVYPLLVESLVNTNLAAAEGTRLGLDKTPEYKSRMKRISNQLLERMLLTQHIEKTITEALVNDRYKKIVENAKGQTEVHARHILVKAEDVAKAIIAKLDGGADFATLAKEVSTGPSGPSGGDLGWFGTGRMVPAFEAGIVALADGEYSKTPIQTKFGWHVIKVEARRPLTVPSLDETRAAIVNKLSAEFGQKLVAELRKGKKIKTTPFADVAKAFQK